MSTRIKHNLSPIYDANTKVLILGSFPSVESRKERFYYANKRNRFWPLMEAIFEESIDDKLAFCIKHHLGLWDVIKECTIENSNDSSITDIIVNDIEQVIQSSSIKTIITTGSKAKELYNKYFDFDVKVIHLPSTSSANARYSFNDLLKEYRIIKDECEKN